MDPNLFRIDWKKPAELIATVVVFSFLVKRALAIVFEHCYFLNKFIKLNIQELNLCGHSTGRKILLGINRGSTKHQIMGCILKFTREPGRLIFRAHQQFVTVRWRAILVGLTCLGLTACTGATSVKVGSQEDISRVGKTYFLPTTRLPIFVIINTADDQIKFVAGDPVYIGDEAHQYRLISNYSLTHADIFKVIVGANELLTTVELKSDGRLNEAAAAAGKSIGAIAENYTPIAGDKFTYQKSIDVFLLLEPEKIRDLNREINVAIRDNLTFSNPTTPFLKAALDRSKDKSPGELDIIKISVSREFMEVTLAPASDQSNQRRLTEDCAVGFCYRIPVSYVLGAKFFDGTIHEAGFAVPNGSPTYAAAVKRGMFATWETKTVLVNGMLQTYNATTEGSELEGLLTLPADLIGGLLAGVTQRGQLFDARSTAVQSQISLAENKEKLRAQRANAENTAGSGKPFFSFVAGTPLSSNAGRPVSSPGNTGLPPDGSSRPGNDGTGTPARRGDASNSTASPRPPIGDNAGSDTTKLRSNTGSPPPAERR